jgi:Tol biopolymer transport system component
MKLTDDPTLKGSIVWSPDGDRIAYAAYDLERDVELLMVMRSDGSDPRVLCEACTGTFLIPSPDEICVDYCGWIGPSPYDDQLSWSPDGRWIAAPATGTEGLSLIDAQSGAPQRVDLGSVFGTSWSPDSGRLATNTRGPGGHVGGLVVVEVPSGETTTLVAEPPYPGSPPAWSPDGTVIAFGRAVHVRGDQHAELDFVDPDTGSIRTILTTDDLIEVYDLEWSPNGAWVAAAYHPTRPPTSGLLVVNGEDIETRLLAVCDSDVGEIDDLCPPNGGNISWSPDGSAFTFPDLAVDGRQRTQIITVLHLDGSVREIDTGLGPGCCVAWQAIPGAS